MTPFQWWVITYLLFGPGMFCLGAWWGTAHTERRYEAPADADEPTDATVHHHVGGGWW